MMVGAILAVILVFVLVQYFLNTPESEISEVFDSVTDKVTGNGKTSDTDIDTVSETSDSVVEPGGIYLRDLPLTDSQQSMAENFGFDVETYYITPETVSCAEASLGADRYQAIIDGESPSLIEATKLMKCL